MDEGRKSWGLGGGAEVRNRDTEKRTQVALTAPPSPFSPGLAPGPRPLLLTCPSHPQVPDSGSKQDRAGEYKKRMMGAPERRPPYISPTPLPLGRQSAVSKINGTPEGVTPDVASRLRAQASRPAAHPGSGYERNFHFALFVPLLAKLSPKGSAGPISQAVPLRITQPNVRPQTILDGRWAHSAPSPTATSGLQEVGGT